MSKKKSTLIFSIVYFAYMSIYVARVNLSIAGPDLKASELLDSAQIGALGSCFFVVYALGRMLNGGLSDIAPPYLMLTVGLMLTGISNFFVSFFPPYVAMCFLWIVNAYAQSMLWSSVLCVVSALYDKKTVKKKSSLMVTSVATGNILSIIINTYVITKFGVKYAFIIPGAIAVIMGILTFFATRKIKNVSTTVQTHTSFFTLLKNRELLKMNGAAMFHGVMKENISLWMAIYIADTYLVDLTKSSFYILLIPVIGFIGRTLYPLFYKGCGENENKVSTLGFVICGIFSLVLCLGKTNVLISALALGIIYTAVSVINTSFLSIYPLSFAKTGNTASVSGIMDFSTYLGAGISSLAYGTVIKHFGYFPMFLSWVVISVISIFILLSNKKKRRSKMKISIETFTLRQKFGDEKALEMIKKAGFDCYDYSMYWANDEKDMLSDDYAEKAKALRSFADSIDLSCNQAHAPFDIKYSDGTDLSNENFLRLVRSLEVAAILGAKNVIVHALKRNLPEGKSFEEVNYEFYRSLLPYCEKFDICVSVENLFNWNEKAEPILSDIKEHTAFVKSLNSQRFNMCIDIGHSAITGHKPEDVLSAADPSLLKSLHIHDNDYKSDLHGLPFTGGFDWEKIMLALKKINYTGEFTFEIFGFLNRLPDDVMQDALTLACKIGKSLTKEL